MSKILALSYDIFLRIGDEIRRIRGIASLQGQKESLDALITKYPEYAVVWYHSALLYEDLGDYLTAKLFYERSIELGFDTLGVASAYFNLALLLENKFNDFINARLNYLNAIAIKPDHKKVYNNLGKLLHSRFRNMELAQKYYTKGLENDSNDANLNHNLGYLLAEEFNDYKLAYAHFIKALQLDPENEDLQHDVALVKKYMDDGNDKLSEKLAPDT